MRWEITEEGKVKIAALGNIVTIDLRCVVGGGCCCIDQYLPVVVEGKPEDEAPYNVVKVDEVTLYYPHKLFLIAEERPARITSSEGWFPHGLEVENVRL
ncbi:CC/Se motif family (seleno)protein [Heliorestis convoluta]|uniref:Uncharacterized protein n=1 Tax=Heliorestis convoluta TaxID=356322 RepID=A0A5Q2N273_9FIRM|nr:CC/Se motif family (seleno)protein [Heliorestis convoluta]QGG49098.1 hypothetical protein FTV88_3023 [Heliorestis convoluta]